LNYCREDFKYTGTYPRAIYRHKPFEIVFKIPWDDCTPFSYQGYYCQSTVTYHFTERINAHWCLSNITGIFWDSFKWHQLLVEVIIVTFVVGIIITECSFGRTPLKKCPLSLCIGNSDASFQQMIQCWAWWHALYSQHLGSLDSRTGSIKLAWPA
jgi:hypothetical protein